MTVEAPKAHAGRLPLPTILTFAAVTLPMSALGVSLAIFLPRYFASHLGVSLVVVGGAFGFVRLIDTPVDPVLGLLMDRTRSAIGRYRVWLLIGAPILMLAVYQLFMAPMGISRLYLVVWLLCLYLGTSIIGLAHTAWASTLATAYHERSRLFAVLTVVGIAASVLVLGIPSIAGHFKLGDPDGVRAMGWLVLCLAPLGVGLVAWRIPEHVAADVHTTEPFAFRDYWGLIRKPAMLRLVAAQACLTLSPGWMSALYLYFFKDVLGFSIGVASGLLGVYILAGVAGAPATTWLSSKIGKHRALMIATSAYSIGLCTVIVIPKTGNLLTAIPVMLWCGGMASGFNLLIQSMTADVGDEVRLEQGKQRMSLIYSLTSLAAKIAGAGAIFLSYWVLARVGYDPKITAHNTAHAIFGLELAYVVGPIVFAMLGGACFIGWKLDAARHGEIRQALDARDLQFAEAAIVESLTGQPAMPVLATGSD
ncbi:MAG TPA: MFS transporter [Caulobacteraceae bacterium]|nr:MFS transporter [Caulobacteraceae bacterium]